MRLQETSISFNNSTFRHNYLCPYLPIAAGMNTLSRSLMKFKRGAHPDMDAWIDYAREALAENPPPRDSILLRALGHRELTAPAISTTLPDSHPEFTARNTRPSPLDLLCQALALDFGCRYLPTLLSKTRETISNKGLSRSEREAELLDVYSANLDSISPATPLLLVDDILTTGATLRAIIGALRRHSPHCPIRVFTLTRAIYAPRRITPLQGQNYYFDPQSGWVRTPVPPSPANSV